MYTCAYLVEITKKSENKNPTLMLFIIRFLENMYSYYLDYDSTLPLTAELRLLEASLSCNETKHKHRVYTTRHPHHT